MAKRAGVSATDYRAYDSGTTIFTRQQNLDAFTPGTTPAHLNFQADKIAEFMVNTNMVPARPSLDRLFDDHFVKASPE
jgi:NitT/TauT family transport system substrate-binding protein